MPRLTFVRRSAASLLAIGALVGCGSDSTGPKQNAFTQQEASLVAVGIMEEISLALSSSIGADVAPTAARLSAVPFTSSSTFSSACTNGGTMAGSFTFTEDFDAQGNGTATGTVTAKPSGCKINTGTRLIAVGGQLTYTFDMKFFQNATLDVFNWRGSGAFTWDGGNCVVDYTVKYTGSGAGSTVVSGTICGVDVSQSF